MRRTLAVTVAVVLVAACGFPAEQFEGAATDASSGSSGGGDARGESSGSSGGEAGGDSSMPSDSSSGADSPMTADAPSESDAPTIDTYIPDVILDVSPDSPQCDRDGDGFDGPQCAGGNDCCDFDKKAFPGQMGFFDVEDVCHSFDYNCNGKDDEEYPTFSCMPGLTGCTLVAGFVGGAVSCGTSGPFAGTCKNQVTSCQAGSTMPQTQACN
jgi:hypothetical protein